ncbi:MULTISPECIES: RNA 2',3'-cyclic phosphodiesterase [Gracilibacillus]|uniref:RNA 2',3'-cyclic phosphodiesterase n=1 Tax=Gracilibacillus TaxID=74385 RepID=UPI0008265FB3|nr:MULTISPECIES: RNA 2',3'-cyclic phosphodiesterase [Gracilibacillus]
MIKHYFIALCFDDETKAWIAEQQRQIYSIFSYKQWVNPADYHLTLDFLGGIGDACLKTLAHQLDTVRHSPFSLTIGGLSYFGNKLSPRVLWMKTEEKDELLRLQKKILHQTQTKEQSFIPHITLAKRWTDRSKKVEETAFDLLKDQKQLMVDRFVVYEIHPERQQKYQVWEEFHLK